MVINTTYLFKSERLGFRNWLEADIAPMAALNTDAEVMEYFPAISSKQQTIEFIGRMQEEFAEKGFCYFAVDRLDTGEFIGFIGLHEQTFEADFTPCIDIGWRLGTKHWNNGFATEGAKRCLEYGFQQLGLNKIVAMAPAINIKSVRVMEKIGMHKVNNFNHPKLKGDARLEDCVLYEIKAN